MALKEDIPPSPYCTETTVTIPGFSSGHILNLAQDSRLDCKLGKELVQSAGSFTLSVALAEEPVWQLLCCLREELRPGLGR